MAFPIYFPKRRIERGDTAAVLATANEVLLNKEWCVETDTGFLKMGDGVTHYNDREYINTTVIPEGTNLYFTDDRAWEAMALAFAGGTQTGITITQNSDGSFDFTASGGGGSVPTGTGFRHVVAGVEDAAAKLVDTADITNLAISTGKIDNAAVTLAKQADVATATVFYRKTAGTGVPEVQTLATLKADLGLTYVATSTTSLATAGSGSKAFTTQAGLSYTPGTRMRATSVGTGEWMEGVVTAYSGTTLTATMDLNSGTGTHADWNINIAGQRGATGPSSRFTIPLCDSAQSTKYGSGNKLVVGRKYFDPNAAGWNLSGLSTATLYMLLETTNASFTAAGDLYRQSGTGSPTTVATQTPTAATTATLVSVDVTAAFIPGANAGIFAARIWITTSDLTNQVTCSGAWIEVQP